MKNYFFKFILLTIVCYIIPCNGNRSAHITLTADSFKNADTLMKWLSTTTNNQVVPRNNYNFSYNERYEQAEWFFINSKSQICRIAATKDLFLN